MSKLLEDETIANVRVLRLGVYDNVKGWSVTRRNACGSTSEIPTQIRDVLTPHIDLFAVRRIRLPRETL